MSRSGTTYPQATASNIISILEAREARDRDQHVAWAAYVSAEEQANRTKLIEDGIKARKAWRLWLDLFDRRR
jgi:hypothetical protein